LFSCFLLRGLGVRSSSVISSTRGTCGVAVVVELAGVAVSGQAFNLPSALIAEVLLALLFAMGVVALLQIKRGMMVCLSVWKIVMGR
jgi:hypothetical protein